MVAPYQVLPTADGELMVAGGNDRLFAAICEVLELSGLVADERFRTNPARVANREALVAILSDRLREGTTADWHERLTAAGVPAAPVADVADVVASPQTEALDFFQPLEHPTIADLRLPALPLSFGRERLRHTSAPPLVGQHSRDVLREAGLADEEIEALGSEGVVRLA
jgi:crotonobetainyl-CoA:carnitine CoA-transferase CaiB-like acyl-CoA transferase